METLNLKTLSKETLKKFKNASKITIKDKNTLYPNLRGVYFCYQEDIDKKILMGSNGKVAIIYIVDDIPNDFLGKVVDVKGNVISTEYPNILITENLDESTVLDTNHLSELYNIASQEVTDNHLTKKKVAKDKKVIGVPIADGLEIDYFFYKDFLKMLEMVGTNIILYRKEMGTTAISCNKDKTIIGVAFNDFTHYNK